MFHAIHERYFGREYAAKERRLAEVGRSFLPADAAESAGRHRSHYC